MLFISTLIYLDIFKCDPCQGTYYVFPPYPHYLSRTNSNRQNFLFIHVAFRQAKAYVHPLFKQLRQHIAALLSLS